MLVREYQDSDLAHLRAIHAKQGFDYALPDFSNPLFVTKKVLARDGTLVGAAFLRLTAEAYLLLDPHAGAPRERWQWLLALHAAAERQEIRQAYIATRLDPRRHLDAVLQEIARSGLARNLHVRFSIFNLVFRRVSHGPWRTSTNAATHRPATRQHERAEQATARQPAAARQFAGPAIPKHREQSRLKPGRQSRRHNAVARRDRQRFRRAAAVRRQSHRTHAQLRGLR